jgi:hypothetical protein
MDDRILEASQQRDMMLRLRASDGWQRMCEIMTATRTALMNEVINNACPGVDAVLVQEFNKGKISALNALQARPDILIDEATAVIDSLKAPEEEEEQADAA